MNKDSDRERALAQAASGIGNAAAKDGATAVSNVSNIGTQVNLLQPPNQGTSSKPRPFYLPPKPVNFVGRDSYFDQLRDALLVPGGMFLLSGDPGCGKSSLALSFAWQVQQQFEAVVFQTCGQRLVESIIGELAETLKEQVGEQVVRLASDEKVRVLRNWLQQRGTLLILDDVWLNDSATHRQGNELGLQDLLPGPPVAILFTSRRPALPFVNARQRAALDAFTVEETEETFRSYLGARTVDRHQEQLLEFGERVQRLPLAVAAAAQLLQNEFGPLDEAARGLRLEQLRTEIYDVPGLLQRAIDAQGSEERQLLLAASVCAIERFWLPLAMGIAGLNASQGGQARNHLVNAGLLRVVEQDRQWFSLHALIREQLHNNEAIEEFRQRHVVAMEELFRDWERRWKECRECLQEIVPASDWLWDRGRDRQRKLSDWAGACAWRIGELDSGLQIEQHNEQLWSGVDEDQSKNGLQLSYGNQALILQDWGRLEEAMALYKKQEALCEVLGNKNGLQTSYGNQALILQAWGRLEEAMALLKKQEGLCEELDNKDGLQRSFGNQAFFLREWGQLKEAMALLKKQEGLCEELGIKNSLQHSYGNQALILQEWGQLKEAMALLKKQEGLCEELGIKNSLQRSYGNQVLILREWGQLKEAMALLKKKEAICITLANKASLGFCYYQWGMLARAMGEEETAEAKLQAALAIFTDLQMPRERDAVQVELSKDQAQSAPAGD